MVRLTSSLCSFLEISTLPFKSCKSHSHFHRITNTISSLPNRSLQQFHLLITQTVSPKPIKMSQALSNLSLFLPVSSGKGSKTVPLNNGGFRLKAMANQARDNLDHLQRVSKINQQQQSQPKKRVAPTPPVGLWDRFPTARTVQQMMETMERMMDDPFVYSAQSGGWAPPLPTEAGGYSRGRTPWEIKEAETEYKMRFDMPGMTKEDVKVWVEEKMLVVKAEKKKKKEGSGNEEEEEGEEWSAKSYGRYSSRIALPENIQFEKIKAEVKDGVLYITIPKAMSSSKVLDINVQ